MEYDANVLSKAALSVQTARRVVAFTGAGISAESGIATFRDNEGLWSRFPPERFATLPGLLKMAATSPRELADFLIAVIGPIVEARPNDGHRAIAYLEKHVDVTVVTQNIDGLHQQAGSTNVLEIHGSLFEIVSHSGKRLRRLSNDDLAAMLDALQQAKEGRFPRSHVMQAIHPLFGATWSGVYRPNIVLFGEAMAEPAWSQALDAARECDCMLVVGTSGLVYPAAGLPSEARSQGARVIAVDPVESFGDFWLQGTAANTLPRLVQAAFGEGKGAVSE